MARLRFLSRCDSVTVGNVLLQHDWVLCLIAVQAQLYRLSKYLARSRTALVPGAGFRTALCSLTLACHVDWRNLCSSMTMQEASL